MFKQFYRKEDKVVGAYVGQYYSQQQGDELVSPDYIFSRERKEAWKKVGEGKISIVLNRKVVNLRKAIISDSNGKYLVWYLYRIGSRYTSNQYIAKIIEAFNWLTFSRRDVAILFFVTPINSDQESAASDLQKFFEAMHEGMEASLDKPIRTIEK